MPVFVGSGLRPREAYVVVAMRSGVLFFPREEFSEYYGSEAAAEDAVRERCVKDERFKVRHFGTSFMVANLGHAQTVGIAEPEIARVRL